MRIICIIPARYKSTRLPGKPLRLIGGKPMLEWVYKRAQKIQYFDEIYIATEDQRIKNYCDKNSMNVIMSSDKHDNGSERVSEVSKKLDTDYFVTLQGDEPFFNINGINNLIVKTIKDFSIDVATLMTPFSNPVDVVNSSTPKVIFDHDNNIIMISRSPIPFPQNDISFKYYKALGVYIFKKSIINNYSSMKKGYLERAEGIELIRFIENKINIKIFESDSDSISIDTEKDLFKINKLFDEGFYED